jgi:thiamine-monophosphate kinase
VAVFPTRAGKAVLKTDMLVEHTDVPPGMTYRQAARKAVAMCVSDFAAKGVKPDSFMVSIGVKKGVHQRQVDELALGLEDARRQWNLNFVGGDTNESKELVIDCAMMGFAEKIVTRGGASPGDALVVTGPFGFPPSGLKLLMGKAAGSPSYRKAAIRSVLEPTPDLGVGLALAKFLTSSMDSSDGLARSVHTLAKESRVGFEVGSLPTGTGVRKFAAANGLDPERLVLEGGEEYVIVGTVKRSELEDAAFAVKRAGGRLLAIGIATERRRVVLREGSRVRAIRNEGWTHLR